MRASEVMIADPVIAAAGATSSEVAALMRVKNISVVPVVDNPKDRHYLGTISDRDIVARCVGAGHDPMPSGIAVWIPVRGSASVGWTGVGLFARRDVRPGPQFGGVCWNSCLRQMDR